MAGMPPPADSGAGRGRGMTLPSWMTGPNAPGSGPPSGNTAPPAGPVFRPSAPGQPSQQQYMHPGTQQFRPPPSVTPAMNSPFSQMPRPNQPPQAPTPQNFPQHQRPGMLPTSAGVTPPFQMQNNSHPWHNQPGAQSSQSSAASVTPSPPSSSSDWQEHSAPDGRRYYYNKKTKVSCWEKPLELMTPLERADASTVWKEFTTADGRKYYYNKLTKQSKWTMPDEMKVARERAENSASPAPAQPTETGTTGLSSLASPSPSQAAVSSPASAAATGLSSALTTASPAFTPVPVASASSTIAVTNSGNLETKVETEKILPRKEAGDEVLAQDIEEAKKMMPTVGNVNVSVAEDKSVSAAEEQPVYASKTEAKNAFKELLEAVHVEADWSWDQAMRVIINDKRYGALKTLGERKQAFNEYLAQKKKQENEEKRLKQKKAREEFVIMLQESKELTSAMRWSKAAALFAEDPRYLAVEKERDRVELFEDYLHDLEKKEKEKAREERKKNLIDYRAYLESCDFIKVTTQWRKVVDKLEDDERFSRLDKIDRLEVFQDYIRHLEKVEEEEKREQKEQQRRKERKNRDEFRKLLVDHRASGVLTARIGWIEYVTKIKEHPAYEAMCSNLSGSTPRDLFEDFAEDLEKKYQEDKAKVKEAIKTAKINVTSTWTFDKFKEAIAEAGDLVAIEESNLKIVYDDFIDRAKEKEEKEAKKKKRLVDDFSELLHSEKSITATSKWEECKPLLENAPEFRALGDDSVRQEVFDEYIALLQQKVKEKEKKREDEKSKKDKDKDKEREKRKDKERKEKDKDKDKEKDRERERSSRKEKEANVDANDRERERSSKKDNDLDEKENSKNRKEKDDMSEIGNNHVQKEEKRKDRDREREKERKHRKSHRSRSSEEISSDRDDRDEGKRSRKHSDKKKSSRKHAYDSNSDSENRHKRHRKDRDAYRKNGGADELEDGELGEDGEIQ